MTPVAERRRCKCGKPMTMTAGGYHLCDNCDGIQPQERVGRPRQKTREDIRYDAYWVREKAKYEDNTVKGESHGEAADS